MNILDLDTDFFAHFAHDAFLQRFTGFDKASQDAEEPGWETVVARQKNLVAAFDADDDRRRQPREAHQAALGADLGALIVGVLILRAAAATMAMVLAPGDDLHRATSDAKEGGAESFGDIAQAVESQIGGRCDVVGEFEGVAGSVFGTVA